MAKQERNSSLKKYIVAEKYKGLSVEEYVKIVMEVAARKRQKLFFSKGVFVNGRPVHSKKILKPGDMVAIREFKDMDYGVKPEAGKIEVLYEDEYLIVLNKPSGILVHPTGQTQEHTLANYLAMYFKEQGKVITIRPLHRLDRDTSGCVLFAKTADIQQRLEILLREGKIHREYEAVVRGGELSKHYPEGIIDLPIGRDTLSPHKRWVNKHGKRAITHFKPLVENSKAAHLSLKLETGRTHQIRVHCAYTGNYVIGDGLYGRKSSLIKRQALHGKSLSLIHPVEGEKLNIIAPLPQDMKDLIEGLFSSTPLRA